MSGVPKRRSRHEGVRCDGCSRADFPGKRYKCLNCYDHDLCETCHEAEATDPNHSIEHAVQCILTPADYELYYAGEAMKKQHSFTCPMCATMGFTPVGLRQHLKSEHGNKEMRVVCPLCAVTAGANPDIMTVDLAVHLALEHVREMDENVISRCLERILATSAGGSAASSAGGGRPKRKLRSSVSMPSLPPSDMDSVSDMDSDMDMDSGVLSEVSMGPQQTSEQSRPGGTEAHIQVLRINLQATRQQLPTVYHQHDRRRPLNPFWLSRMMSSFPGTRAPPPLSLHTRQTLVEQPTRNDPRFLLNGLVEEGVSHSQEQDLEVERTNRNLFVQELLLNTLEAQAPAGADGKSTGGSYKPRPDSTQ
ncbi:E3 ubiquitin-protein ligase KCMF1-like [Haemaphysalis longicornis]